MSNIKPKEYPISLQNVVRVNDLLLDLFSCAHVDLLLEGRKLYLNPKGSDGFVERRASQNTEFSSLFLALPSFVSDFRALDVDTCCLQHLWIEKLHFFAAG